MRQLVQRWPGAVCPQCRFKPIKRGARRQITDHMHMDLEPRGIKGGEQGRDQVRRKHQGCIAALRIAVGGNHRRSAVFQDAVHEELGRIDLEIFRSVGRAQRRQPGHNTVGSVIHIHLGRPGNPQRHAARRGQRRISAFLITGDRRIQHPGDAKAVGMRLPCPRAVQIGRIRRGRQTPARPINRIFVQHAGWDAVCAPHQMAVRRIGHIPRDPDHRAGGRI